MATFFTDTGSLGLLEVSSSSGNVVTVKGSGSSILVVSGSRGPLIEVSDVTGGSDVFVLTSGSIDILTVKASQAVIISGSLNVTQGITSSLLGSASYAVTAAFALNGGGGPGGSDFPYTGSAIISGSLQVTGSTSIIGSGSRIFVVSGSTGGLLEVGDSGPSDVFSISSGSTEIFRIDNNKIVAISGSLVVTGSITGSLLGTASYVTASSVFGPFGSNSVVSSSYALTASFALNAGSGGGGGGTSYPVTSTGISIADPTSAEDVTLLYTSASVTIQAVEGVVRGSATPTVTVTLRYDADRNAAGTAIVSAQSVSSTTTGNNLTLTANTTVPAGNFVWLETTATSGTVNELFVGLLYRSGSV